MNEQQARRVHHATALITVTGILFFTFFQLAKREPFRSVNPFGEDPYDAVGSFAVQIALLIGALTYARALRTWRDSAQANKLRFILRGNLLVLVAIGTTVLVDALAEILRPLPRSYWGSVLLVGLAAMALLALACYLALAAAFRRPPVLAPPTDLTPADGFDDLWTLVQVPVVCLSAILPHGPVQWVQRFSGDALFARLPWINPRTHPWRFATVLGLLVGLGLLAAQMQEGLPPSLAAGLIVAAIFISAETLAGLVGFALLDGYLGLRPAFRAKTTEQS
jgi:hypothetical protein